ncbi:MAG: hypothetical protein EBQ64_05895, partial [Acidimicrobiia bacterium]|nr:hypothetical protein [Acidimicrobiia bacterium]
MTKVDTKVSVKVRFVILRLDRRAVKIIKTAMAAGIPNSGLLNAVMPAINPTVTADRILASRISALLRRRSPNKRIRGKTV